MPDLQEWQPLLAILAEGPRENGTPGLARAAERLVAWSEAAGLEPVLLPFVAHPWALWLGGLVALAGSLLYWRLLRDGRAAAALAVALATPAVLVADLEGAWPTFSRLHAARQHHVALAVEPSGPVEQQVIVTAHYDTKTDLLDHAAREPVEAAALPVVLWMAAGAALALAGVGRRGEGAPGGRAARAPWRRGTEAAARRAARAVVASAPWVALVSGLVFFATLSGGAFLPTRSPGALDDGAACAVALRLAERTAAAPLVRTRLEVILLSGEEVGTQGARALARDRFARPPELPTAVLNLEILGAAPDLAALARERFTLRSYPADPALVERVDAVHRARRGAPLHVAGAGVTDARELLARGVPAVTLASAGAVRGLHSPADDRSRIDPEALEEHLALLAATLQHVEIHGL